MIVTDLKAAYIGTTPVEKIYQGSTLIVDLTPSPSGNVDVTDYNYEMSGTEVTLTEYIGSSTDVTTPNV